MLNKLLSIFEQKASRAAWVIAPPGSGVVWPTRNYDNFAKEAYMGNVIASRCIREIAEAVASVPWKVVQTNSKGEKVDQPNHWLTPLLNRANPYESFAFMMMKTAAYYELSGNSFMERVKLKRSGEVKELYSHRPSRFKILVNPSTGLLTGYTYEVNGKKQDFPVSITTQQGDILHLKTFNPLDDWWGASSTEMAAKEIDTKNQATDWNFNLLQNQARPGMQYLFKGRLSDDEFERLEKTLQKYAGPKGVGKPLIIDGADEVKAEPGGWNPQEMEFLEGNRELARSISLAYGCPPQILGIPGDNTYSNMKEARLAFWETIIFFRVNYYKGELNNWLLDDEKDLSLEPDFNQVAALEPRHEKKWERVKVAEGVLTINERREMLGFEPIDDGDVILVPATMLPLGEEPELPDDNSDDDEGDDDSNNNDDEDGDDE